MTIHKLRKEDHSISPRSISVFHFYNQSKISRVTSILRKKNKMRFRKQRASVADRLKHASRAELQSTLDPLTCHFHSEKILKILLPNDLDSNHEVPSSFSPPSNKIPRTKMNNESKEISCDNGITRSTNSVRFHSKVLVMRIPSRQHYPEPIKRNLWCSLSEIARSAHRNTIEFSSEGWDWRSAVEEESMYIHPKTGQHIHPIHIQRTASTTSSIPEVGKLPYSTSYGGKTDTVDKYNVTIAHVEPAHE